MIFKIEQRLLIEALKYAFELAVHQSVIILIYILDNFNSHDFLCYDL